MSRSLFVFSPVEQATLARLLRDFPASAAALEAGVRPIVDRLIRECRGVLRSQAEADYVLAGLADRIAGRTLPDIREADDAGTLQVLAVDLMARHCLARVRDEFLRGVLDRNLLQTDLPSRPSMDYHL
jgi:hypothetical protein